ncbi:MAG: DsbA family protein [Chloroflexi bacterium]|nr:MAG: DsbA family protein [Chloroflexota bacterium]
MENRKGKTKREEVRARRRRQQMLTRLAVIAVIGGVVLLLVGLIVLPPILQSIRDARAPVGEIVQITPFPYPESDGKTMGDPNAPVRIDVYEDFQCPACGNYSTNTERQIIEEYIETGEVYYVYHHFPFIDDISVSKESDQAANASMCAAEQGRFWDYHDILFTNWSGENEGAFRDNRLLAFAEELDLDMDQFEACFDENRYEDVVNEDIASARSLGVDSTPSVFVNGELLTPGFVPSFSDVQQAVENALASSQ